jgi:hypothetical protein
MDQHCQKSPRHSFSRFPFEQLYSQEAQDHPDRYAAQEGRWPGFHLQAKYLTKFERSIHNFLFLQGAGSAVLILQRVTEK